MTKKLTLSEKRLLNEHVTGETKRCLAILSKIKHNLSDFILENTSGDKVLAELHGAMKKVIEDSPYIEFHPELLKRIPE